MTAEQHQDEADTTMDVTVIPAESAVAAPEPEAPAELPDQEAEELRARARDVAERISESSGSKSLELIDGLATLGAQAQRRSGEELDLLRARIGDIFTRGGPGAEVSGDLLRLRVALRRIDPNELSRPGPLRRVFGFLPAVGRSMPALRMLEKISQRHASVSKEVEMIETRLREGKLMITRDNVELRKLYEQVEADQLPIRKNAYLGELIMRELSTRLAQADDLQHTERLRSALHDVSMRVQDLRIMEEVQYQFFASIEMVRENNSRLAQAVQRTLDLGSSVVTVGLAIQVALGRQQRVLEATKQTREFLGGLVAANAAAIKRHTTEIGDVYNSPVIAIDKLTQAHGDLVEALTTAERLKQEGIEAAREHIARVAEMSGDLRKRAGMLPEQASAAPASIEA